MLAKFVSLKSVAHRNTLLPQYKTIAISFERTGQTLNLDLQNKQMTMPKAQFQQMKSTKAMHIRPPHGI